MRQIIYGIFCCLVWTGCSENNTFIDTPDEGNKENEEVVTGLQEKCKFLLTAKKTEVNIFDLVELSILDNKGNYSLFYFSDLKTAYDSIVWKVKGLDGNCRIFNTASNEGGSNTALTSAWSHCFSLPGNYETFLLGYKEDLIIHSDTLFVQVTDKKDFVGRNWSDTDNLGVNTGYHNTLNEKLTFCTLANVENNKPYIDLRLWNTENTDEAIFQKVCETELYKFMGELYGSPIYDKNATELSAVYAQFEIRSENVIPLAYWETNKAQIILLNEKASETGLQECYIHAEPIGN